MRFVWILAAAAMLAGGCTGVDDGVLRARCISVWKNAFDVEGDENFWAKMHAAEALTAAGQQWWVKDRLRGMLEKGRNAQHLCGLCREMIRAGAPEYEQRMITTLEQPASGGQTHAAESLFKVGKLGRPDLMRKTADAKDPILAMMASAALIRAGEKQRLERIRDNLEANEERTRVVACWVLGQLGDASDIERIEKAAALWKGDARFNADVALARMGKASMIDRLLVLLKDKEESRVAGVCEALAAMKIPRARGHLVPLLDDPRLDVRVRAAHALLGILKN